MKTTQIVSLFVLSVVAISSCSSPADSGQLERIAGSYSDIKSSEVGELSGENTLPVLAATCMRIPVLMNNWLDEYVDPENIGSANLQMMESTYSELDEELTDIVYLFDNAGYTDGDAPRFAGEPDNQDPLVGRYGSALLELKWKVGRTPYENGQLLGVNGEYPEFMPSADVDDEMDEFERVCAELVTVSDQ